jgi:hypothetical protein
LLDVQVLIKSPIAGLKTLSEKTSSLAEAITRASDQLRVLKDDLTSLIAGEVAWAQVDKAGLQVFSGFESLGLTQLIAYGYGPGHPISLRIRALARLRDWAKATDCLEFEATVESHLAFCKLDTNLTNLGETLAEVAVEAASTSTFSTREFFAVCNLSKTNDHVLARDLSLVCVNSMSKLIPLVGKAEHIWDAQFSWFNESLRFSSLSPVRLTGTTGSLMDRIESENPTEPAEGQPLVSVIVPAYNAETWLATALKGLQSQTHSRLEIIVVDDASTDATVKVALKFQSTDHRIKVLTNEANKGVYACRNRALAVASGDYVTVHDADDWSHPRKIELQLAPLEADETVIATTSEAIRVAAQTFEVLATRNGDFVRPNFSSLLFRREKAISAIGFWDEVRFGADSEFKSRLIAVFGTDAVLPVVTGPVSLTRSWSGSLTGGGIDQPLSGARKVYRDSFKKWHSSNVEQLENLNITPGQPRKFFAPRACFGDPSESFSAAIAIAADFSENGSGLALLRSLEIQKPASLQQVIVVHIPSASDPQSKASTEVEQICVETNSWPSWWLQSEFGEGLRLQSQTLIVASSSCLEKYEGLPKMAAQDRVLLLESESALSHSRLQKISWNFSVMFGEATTIVAPSKFSAKALERELESAVQVRSGVTELFTDLIHANPVEESPTASLP